MDGRRRNPKPFTEKKILKNPQTKIKELKKDIETFETEVNRLLEDVVEAGSMDNLCIECQNPIRTAEQHDLPCQHVLCETCFLNQIKNHRLLHCPQCSHHQPHQSPFFYIHSRNSSSSSEDS